MKIIQCWGWSWLWQWDVIWLPKDKDENRDSNQICKYSVHFYDKASRYTLVIGRTKDQTRVGYDMQTNSNFFLPWGTKASRNDGNARGFCSTIRWKKRRNDLCLKKSLDTKNRKKVMVSPPRSHKGYDRMIWRTGTILTCFTLQEIQLKLQTDDSRSRRETANNLPTTNDFTTNNFAKSFLWFLIYFSALRKRELLPTWGDHTVSVNQSSPFWFELAASAALLHAMPGGLKSAWILRLVLIVRTEHRWLSVNQSSPFWFQLPGTGSVFLTSLIDASRWFGECFEEERIASYLRWAVALQTSVPAREGESA